MAKRPPIQGVNNMSNAITGDTGGQTNETTPVGSTEVGPDPKRWSVLAVVVIVQLMVVLDASIVTIALPSAQRALHISAANRQWVITAYTFAFCGLLLLGGPLAEFGGPRRMAL